VSKSNQSVSAVSAYVINRVRAVPT